jgi:hypothetical protein
VTQSATPFASLSGIPITRLHLVVPAQGIWHADVALTTAIDVPGPQTLLLAGSTWIGAVVRAVDFSGVRGVRLVGGAGGWRKTVPALPYGPSPVGVPTSTILGDLAATIQELPPVLDPTVLPTVGNYYVRQHGAASLVLWDLLAAEVLQTWWMNPAGVIQTSIRLPVVILSPFVAEAVRGESGWYRIATDSPGDWIPGATFASPTVSGTISRVEHRIQRGRFWTEVLAA